MNNLIFNTTASELKATMYGYNQTSLTLQQLQLDSGGNMLITGNITVNNAVTISNATLTVEGSVTVSNPVTIANTSLTVEGSVTVSNPVTIANTTLTVLISGQTFTSNTDSLADITGAGTVFTATNISTLTTASMFIDNIGTNPITVSLQLSPDGSTYFNDSNFTNQVVLGGANTIIAIGKFAQFAQLTYDTGILPATFNAYYNGQA